MGGHQALYRSLESVGIDCSSVEFDVQVCRYPTELLILRSADPVRVLHGGQRERRVLAVLTICFVRHGLLIRGHLVIRPQQRVPGVHRRLGRQLSEGDTAAPFAPSTGQSHHADRVQSECDEVIAIRNILGCKPDEVGDRQLDLVPTDCFHPYSSRRYPSSAPASAATLRCHNCVNRSASAGVNSAELSCQFVSS
ncbi:Uncharacterised protein [Mycobacteroides abscessus subsp. abscessus]|nr:Uncharacterised protein [Mycobacteroides abscessus subsp. abscessus]SHX89588.1 Uncharacterised protein [Mycobacteroides abscessus subsp. abscessus]SIA94922.1 Uncharacterised protein [Mycobacteroides abscessus subsp. abscessus]